MVAVSVYLLFVRWSHNVIILINTTTTTTTTNHNKGHVLVSEALCRNLQRGRPPGPPSSRLRHAQAGDDK
jgi:hypothetical protein